MMYEYKVVPAPARAVRVPGLKTTSDRFAHLLTEALNVQAGDGWEFLRTEILPCEERKGLTGTRATTQVVMVFRRAVAAHVAPAGPALSGPDPRAEPRPAPVGETRRAEPVFRPGALSRTEGERAFPPLRAAPPPDDGDGQR